MVWSQAKLITKKKKKKKKKRAHSSPFIRLWKNCGRITNVESIKKFGYIQGMD